MVAARQYADGNETRAEYRAIRERLYGRPKVVNIAVEEKRAVERYRQEQSARFEELRMAKQKEEEEIKPEEVSLWEVLLKHGTKGRFCIGNVIPYWSDDASAPLDLTLLRDMTEIAVFTLANKEFRGISLEQVKGKSRTVPVVAARRAVAVAIRKERPELSTPQIGRFMCKDHTSILNLLGRTKTSRRNKLP